MFYQPVVICLFAFVFIVVHASLPVEEKPLDCPENEQYYKCTLEACYKKCADLINPPPCPAIAAGCFVPGCLCKREFLRNADGVCVPIAQCKSTEEAVKEKLDTI